MRALALVVVLVSSSCALAFQESLPNDWHPRREPRCTTTRGWVAWDVLNVTGAGIGAVALYANANALKQEGALTEESEKVVRVEVALFVVVALLHATSAGFGLNWADECEAARERRDAWEERRDRRQEPAPPPPARGVLPPLPAELGPDAGAVDSPGADAGV